MIFPYEQQPAKNSPPTTTPTPSLTSPNLDVVIIVAGWTMFTSYFLGRPRFLFGAFGSRGAFLMTGMGRGLGSAAAFNWASFLLDFRTTVLGCVSRGGSTESGVGVGSGVETGSEETKFSIRTKRVLARGRESRVLEVKDDGRVRASDKQRRWAKNFYSRRYGVGMRKGGVLRGVTDGCVSEAVGEAAGCVQGTVERVSSAPAPRFLQVRLLT